MDERLLLHFVLIHSELTFIDSCSAQFPTYVGLGEIYDPGHGSKPAANQ